MLASIKDILKNWSKNEVVIDFKLRWEFFFFAFPYFTSVHLKTNK